MTHLTRHSVNLPALLLSVAIALVLLSGLSRGFSPMSEHSVCVIQLPTVTVHGKRLPIENAVVAHTDSDVISTNSHSAEL